MACSAARQPATRLWAQLQHAYEPVQADEPAWHVRFDTTQCSEACVHRALAAIEVGRAEGDQHSQHSGGS